MSDDRVHVVAHFAVKPDSIEQFIQKAKESLVAPTLGEPGCIAYELCQDTQDPSRFAMIETWASEEALSVHLAQKSLQAAVAALAPLAAEAPTVQRFRSTG